MVIYASTSGGAARAKSAEVSASVYTGGEEADAKSAGEQAASRHLLCPRTPQVAPLGQNVSWDWPPTPRPSNLMSSWPGNCTQRCSMRGSLVALLLSPLPRTNTRELTAAMSTCHPRTMSTTMSLATSLALIKVALVEPSRSGPRWKQLQVELPGGRSCRLAVSPSSCKSQAKMGATLPLWLQQSSLASVHR